MASTLTTPTGPAVAILEYGKYLGKAWSVTGPSSYATGGEVWQPATVGMAWFILPAHGLLIPSGGGTAIYANMTVNADGTGQLQYYWTLSAVAGTAQAIQEVANATNLSTYSGVLVFTGKGR